MQKILLISDNKNITAQIQEYFSKSNITFIECIDEQSILNYVDTAAVELVIIDEEIKIINPQIICRKIQPNAIKNNALYHVGNGRYGSKIGALLILLIPLFGFCPSGLNEEIHSTDLIERAELQEKIDKRAEEIQLYVALFCSMVACLVMLGGLFLC